VAPSAHAVLILDSAGWHQTSGKLIVPHNSHYCRYRPYAPELNPMENVWEYLRANKLNALVWDSYEQIIDACSKAWNWFANDPARIQSIGTRNRAWVNV
jgi:transposase